MKLKYVEITYENIILATEFEMKLFPDFCGFISYENAIKNNMPYFLVYNENNELIGTTGLYRYDELGEKNTVWLGWYGVDKAFRKRGYGKQILLDMFERAKELKFDTLRLYTSAVICPEAMKLYNQIMDFGEPYNLEEKELQRWVFTKSLIPNKKAKKWGTRCLYLNLEREKEDEALAAYKRFVAKK